MLSAGALWGSGMILHREGAGARGRASAQVRDWVKVNK
uniref:Uncharacterized protein n=1 Tax=Anguilla anguilla TaxID=7936 RepID=A0A0E9VBZ8_ANGAN